MSHFKPGDLALIIGTTGRRPELIGRTVQIVERVPLISGPGWTWMEGPWEERACEKHLMPLRGDFAPEQQKSREVVQ